MAHQVLSPRQICRVTPELRVPVPCGVHRQALGPRKRAALQPCAGYRRYDRSYYGRSPRGFWEAASGFSSTLRDVFEQLEEDLKNSDGEVSAAAAAAAAGNVAADVLRTPVDSLETEDDIVYYVDVPGLEKKDLKIQVNGQDRTLTVSGERFQPVMPVEEDSTKHVKKFERNFGKFSRKLTLPESADLQLISAKVDKGVLRIKVLKQIKANPEIQEVEID